MAWSKSSVAVKFSSQAPINEVTRTWGSCSTKTVHCKVVLGDKTEGAPRKAQNPTFHLVGSELEHSTRHSVLRACGRLRNQLQHAITLLLLSHLVSLDTNDEW